MNMNKLVKKAWGLFAIGALCLSVTGCSSDDEPSVLENVTADGSSFQLNEAGEVSLQFTVSPENASIDNVALVGGAEAFELGNPTSAGNGKWAVSLNAKDFAQIGEQYSQPSDRTGRWHSERGHIQRGRPLLNRREI